MNSWNVLWISSFSHENLNIFYGNEKIHLNIHKSLGTIAINSA